MNSEKPDGGGAITRPLWAGELNPDGTWRTDYTNLVLPEAKPVTAKPRPRAVCGTPKAGEFQSAAPMSNQGKPLYVLPSGDISDSEAAEVFFHDLGQMEELFIQGSKIVEVLHDPETGEAELWAIGHSALRTRLDLLGPMHIYRRRGNLYSLCTGRASEETAKALLFSRAARTYLPRIRLVVNCPIITGDE
jgi:hypothetical protein